MKEYETIDLTGMDTESARKMIDNKIKNINKGDFAVLGFHTSNDEIDNGKEIVSHVWKERPDGDYERTSQTTDSLSCSKVNAIGKKQHFPDIYGVDYRYGFYDGRFTYVIGGFKSKLAEWQVDDNEIAIINGKILIKFVKEGL